MNALQFILTLSKVDSNVLIFKVFHRYYIRKFWLKCLKGEFRIFIDFLKTQPKRHLKKKIVAPLKRVYLDVFPSYEAGNYVTIQQSDKKWCKASHFNEKKSLKLSETSKRIDFWKTCRAPIVCPNGYFWMYFMKTFT